MKPFNPLEDVPTTDGQAEITIKYGKHEVVGACGWGLYCIFRQRDGATVIQAYERALRAMIGEPTNPQAGVAP